MHSWQDLKAEILRQKILELSKQPTPKDLSAYVQLKSRILKLERELNSLLVANGRSTGDTLMNLMKKSLYNPEDVSQKEMIKATDDVQRTLDMLEHFSETNHQKMRAKMRRNWQYASPIQRGRMVTVYSMYTIFRGLQTIPRRGLRLTLNMARWIARKHS